MVKCNPTMYKKWLCRHWLDNQECPYATDCRFAHGPKELRSAASLASYCSKFLPNSTKVRSSEVTPSPELPKLTVPPLPAMSVSLPALSVPLLEPIIPPPLSILSPSPLSPPLPAVLLSPPPLPACSPPVAPRAFSGSYPKNHPSAIDPSRSMSPPMPPNLPPPLPPSLLPVIQDVEFKDSGEWVVFSVLTAVLMDTSPVVSFENKQHMLSLLRALADA